MRTLAVALGLFVFAACVQPAPAVPSPLVQNATQPPSIPLQPIALAPHGPLVAGKNVGSKGAQNVDFGFTDAPKDGLDAIRITLTPTLLANPPANFIYWAFNGYFEDGRNWYYGLQPNGQYGQTALFSVFGPDSTGRAASCKAGADYGAGTSCHIPYAWSLGRSYEFIVRLAGGDSQTMIWEGAVADLTTGIVTVIGDIAVSADHGLLKPTGVTFAEFFHKMDCGAQPRSELLFLAPIGYRSGREFYGHATALNANSGCNPEFFSDGKSYVYLTNGTVP